MAISLLGRTLIVRPKPNVLPSILPRSKFFSSTSPRLADVGVRFRPVVALRELPRVVHGWRCFSTRSTTSSLSDPSPNWSNRPPKETILLDGCDFEHWLIVLEKPEEGKTRDDIIGDYIKTAASVIGSEEEARKKIYSVSTRHYFAFGVIVSEEDSYKFKELPGVRWVLPDSYLDVRNKDYGGEPFINGEAVPYDPKYHEEWVQNNARATNRRDRRDRPRNVETRKFGRREYTQERDFRPNMGGGPAPNMQPPIQNTRGIPPNANSQNTAPNFGGLPPHANAPNYGTVPPNANVPSSVPNYGAPNANIQSNAPNYGTNPNTMNNMPYHGGFPSRDAGPNAGFSNNANRVNTVPHYGGMPQRDAVPNHGYSSPNVGGGVTNAGNRDFQYRDAPYSGGNPPYPSREGPVPAPQNSYTPNMPSGNAYQVRDIP